MPVRSLCYDLQFLRMPTPSLLIVPARFKSGKLYSQIPTSGAGDFTVTRATTATRVNASGFIESVASGIPRLDYFSSDGTVGCPALLVEPAATNNILQSTDSASGWTLNGSMTSATIDVIGVSGVNLTVGASGTIGGGASSYSSPIASPVISLVSGSTYTVSFFTKRTTAYTFVAYYMTFAGAALGSIGSGFDVSGSFSSGSMGGVYNTAGVTNRIRRVERWGTDVFRCSETFTMTASGTVGRINIAIPTGASSQTSAPIGTTIGFAAPQLELGSVPTSFIPTTTGSVTRNADVVSVTGAVSGSIGQLSGTIYAEVDVQTAFLGTILTIDDGDTSDFISITKNANLTIRARIRRASGTITSIITSAAVSVGTHKIALAYTNGDYALYIDGVSAGTSTNSTDYPATSLTQCVLSNANYGPLNDRILDGALYTTRLSNAELAALTSL